MKVNLNLLFIVVLIVFTVSTATANSGLAQSDTVKNQELKKITIASEPSYPPYCMVDKNGYANGFSVELFKAAAKAVGINVDIKVGLWDKIKQDLADGNIDALPFVGRTPERENLFDFTLPYLSLHGAVFVEKGNNAIHSLNDLKNKVVGVVKGDNSEEFVLRNKITDQIIVTHTFNETFELLVSGEVDAVVTQRLMGINLLKEMKIKTIKPLDFQIPAFRQDFCFAVKKGDKELLNRLNEGLSIVIANKTYDELRLKWFGSSLNGKVSFKDVLLLSLNIIIPALIIIGVVAIVLLRRTVRRRTQELRSEVAEHRATLIKLNQQQQLFNKVEQVALLGGWEFNTMNEMVTWTDFMFKIFDLSPSEFDASSVKNNLTLFCCKEKRKVIRTIAKSIAEGLPFELEINIKTNKGAEKWISASGQPEFFEGKIIRVFGSVMDITQHKIAEKAIEVSESNFMQIFNSTNEAIFVHDVESFKIVDVNQRTLEMYGYNSKEEFLNGSVSDFSSNQHPFTEDEAKLNIQKAIEVGSKTFDWVAKRKNGEIFWVEVSLKYAILNNQKRIIAIVKDITDRKKAEEQFRKLNNELIAIFKASIPLQNLRTPKKLASEILQVLEELLNYSFAVIFVVGSDNKSIVPFALSSSTKETKYADKDIENIAYQDLAASKGIIEVVIKTGKTIRLDDVTKDNRYVPFRESTLSKLCVPIKVEDKVVGVINIETDHLNAFSESDERILETIAIQVGIAIQNANLYQQVHHELKKRASVEAELRQLNQELELKVESRTSELNEQVAKLDKSQKAMLYMVEDLNDMTNDLKNERQKLTLINKELEAFSYSVSHDLRAPLRAIDGFSKIILEDYGDNLDKEAQRLFSIVRDNSQKMDMLITGLLSLSRVSRNELIYTHINMTLLAKSVFDELACIENVNNVELIIGELPFVNADSILLKQVWHNLIGNAFKYSRPKPHRIIEIGASTDKGVNKYFVKDNGVGFNQEYTHKIFETFHRLHKETEFEGTGIGLSIVHRIITRHNGRVWGEGKEGVGATIWFELPNKE